MALHCINAAATSFWAAWTAASSPTATNVNRLRILTPLASSPAGFYNQTHTTDRGLLDSTFNTTGFYLLVKTLTNFRQSACRTVHFVHTTSLRLREFSSYQSLQARFACRSSNYFHQLLGFLAVRHWRRCVLCSETIRHWDISHRLWLAFGFAILNETALGFSALYGRNDKATVTAAATTTCTEERQWHNLIAILLMFGSDFAFIHHLLIWSLFLESYSFYKLTSLVYLSPRHYLYPFVLSHRFIAAFFSDCTNREVVYSHHTVRVGVCIL